MHFWIDVVNQDPDKSIEVDGEHRPGIYLLSCPAIACSLERYMLSSPSNSLCDAVLAWHAASPGCSRYGQSSSHPDSDPNHSGSRRTCFWNWLSNRNRDAVRSRWHCWWRSRFRRSFCSCWKMTGRLCLRGRRRGSYLSVAGACTNQARHRNGVHSRCLSWGPIEPCLSAGGKSSVDTSSPDMDRQSNP